MGKNSRSRRDAKRRKQDARRRSKQGATDPRSNGGTNERTDDAEPCPCASCQPDASEEASEAERMLLDLLAMLWANGWQPTEVVRQVHRLADRVAAELLTLAVLADDGQRDPSSRDPRWISQIESLQRTSGATTPTVGWYRRWASTDPVSRSRIDASVTLFQALTKLGPIHCLIPPPGSDRVDAVSLHEHQHESDPVLELVRALLAKAESTEFAAEAEVFTAKAQALITRHALDDLLRSTDGSGCRPACIRISVDEPYVSAKAVLLHAVAEASRCRSIQLSLYAMCSVIGRPEDLRRVEILFTSLLVQAQSALNEVGRTDAPGSPTRGRSFRSAFLHGYASRIGERLIAERDRVTADVGSEALPILTQVGSAIDDEVDRLFGDRLTRSGTRRCDALGWDAGSGAAERAQIRDGGLRSTDDLRQLTARASTAGTE